MLLSAIAARALQFASGVNLVEVYATVVDAHGEPLTGLSRSDFLVEEDGRPQRIETFAAGNFPLALAIAVDRSFSVPVKQLAAVRAASARFVDALREDDQVMVLAIGSGVEVVAPLSANHRPAKDGLMRLEPWGTTPLFDAILSAIGAIEPAQGRRALILLSDGKDRYSQATQADIVARARRSGVISYPIALGRERPELFAELAAVTGGRSFAAGNERALSATLDGIARELRFQYLLGYTPDRPAGERGEWRSIQVTVNRPDVRVRARDGYLSP